MTLLRSLGSRHICREPSGLLGYVSKVIHCRLGNRCNDSLSNHVIKCILDLFLVLYGYLALGMLYRKDVGVCPEGVHPGYVANGVEGVGES